MERGNRMRSSSLALSKACLAWAAAAGISSACYATDYTVNPSLPQTGNNYQTLQAAFAGVPSGASESNPNRIIISPGTYFTSAASGSLSGDPGSASFTESANNIDLIGSTGNPNDVIITSALQAGSFNSDTTTGGTFAGGTGATYATNSTSAASSILIKGTSVAVSGVTIANSCDMPYLINTGQATFGTKGSIQAVALQVTGDQVTVTNSKILGYQDTLYVKGGRNYFTNDTISGNDDFIFATSTAVFQNNTINIDGNHNGGCITAASTNKDSANGLVFLNNTITGNSVQNNPVIDSYGSAIATGAAPSSFNLGRPWGFTQTGGDSAVDYINNTFATNAITPAGWIIWNSSETNPIGDSRYAEYGNVQSDGVTPVDTSGRVSWDHFLTAAQAAQFTLPNIFSVGGVAARTAASGAFWYGAGYSDPNSWPSYWGPRNAENALGLGSGSDIINGNPAAYNNTLWSNSSSVSDATWDPTVQMATLNLPEPASITLVGGALAGLLSRRRRSC